MEENVKIEKLEETQNVKKKINKGLVIIIIIFALIILVLIGYICYDKGIIFNKSEISSTETENEKKSNSTTEETTKEENLDINSRLVQYLYNLVSNDTDNYNWTNGWEFWNNSGDKREKEFDIATATEQVKMTLVGRNLKERHKEFLTCDSSIPDSTTDSNHSICYENKRNDYHYGNQYGYSKSYVESIYKELFGKDANLDTNTPIYAFWTVNGSYYYNKTVDKYVLYLSEGGGTAAAGEKYTLASAKRIDNQIIITQNVEYSALDNPVENYKYIYTFETEDDGMYRFVSRVKEK